MGGGYYVVRDIFQELKLRPKESLPIVAKALSEVSASVPNDASSQTLNDAEADPQSHSSLCSAYHSSPVVADPVFQVNILLLCDQFEFSYTALISLLSYPCLCVTG